MMAGVLALNLLFVVAGLGILWAFRGWSSWNDLGATLGLVYLTGLMAVGVEGTLALIAGVGISRGAIAGMALGTGAVAAAVGAYRRLPLPRGLRRPAAPSTVGEWLGVLAGALAVVFTAALYRAFRHEPVIAYDTWAFWVPKAQTIFYFDKLDEQLFQSLPGPSYPLMMPTLDAMAYRFAGSTSPFALNLQYWLLFVGFLGTLPALLRGLARRGLTALFVAVVALLPETAHRLFQLQADWPLDMFFAVSSLLMLRWIALRDRWALLAYPIALAAMLATKREGQLLAFCLVAAALVATVRTARRDWLLIVGTSALAYSLNIPWRLWWTSRHLTPDTPPQLYGSLSRLGGSIRIVSDLAFGYHLFLFAVPVALVAVAALLSARGLRPLTVFAGTAFVLVFAGLVWIMWTNPTYVLTTKNSATPLPRATASLALLGVVLSPVLLTDVLAPLPMPVLLMRPGDAFRREWPRLRDWVVALSPMRVVAFFIAAEWIEVIGLFTKVRHAGWLFYQGGDQFWYYTTGWLLVHGHFPQPGVGYLWALVMAPFALVAGPDILDSLPGIVILQVAVLLPVAIVALYGIASRIAGRLFAYWTLALWLVLPVFGIVFTNTGYHQRYTELLLPQAFGLTGMADFPTMVMTIVAVYFCLRAVADAEPQMFHALAGGVAAGAVVALKPSGALFLTGVVLAFLASRRIVHGLAYGIALLPAAGATAFWKLWGFGHLSAAAVHAHAGPPLAVAAPVVALSLHGVFHFDWSHLSHEFDLLREHFWSGRVIQWLPVAGTIGLARKSRPAVLLIAGWFGAYVVAKGTYQFASIEDGSLLRIMIPAFPAFVLLVAGIPLLVPGVVHRVRPQAPGLASVPPRHRGTLLLAGVLLTAVIPFAAIAAASPERAPSPIAAIVEQPPVPTEVDFGLRAERHGGAVSLTWRDPHPLGAPAYFHVYRAPADANVYSCASGRAAQRCVINLTDIGETRDARFVDTHPGHGRWRYRVGLNADWLNDTAFGDTFEISKSLVVTVP